MRTFISQETDAIITDEEFDNLLNYSRRRRSFLYEFSVRVDQIKAIRLNATTLRLTVRKIKRRSRKRTFNKEVTAWGAINSLLVDRPKKKDAIRARQKDYIMRRNVDFTRRMNNEIARYIGRLSDEDAEELLPWRYVYEFKTVQELKEEREDKSYNNAMVRDEDFEGLDAASIQAAALDSINMLHRDPAKFVMTRNKFITQDHALMGTIPSSETQERRAKAKIIKILRKDLVSRSVNTMDDLHPDELIPVRVRAPRRYVTVRRRMAIRRKKMRNLSRFEVIIELLDEEGAVVQREVRMINHQKHVSHYYLPRRAPLIRYAGCEPGRNIIEITQRDKKCSAVRVYKRIINDSAPLINADWELVGHFNMRKRGRRRKLGRGKKRIHDMGPNSNPVVYRAVSVRGRNEGMQFRSVVAPPCKFKKEVATTKNKFATLFPESREDGAHILIQNFDKSAAFASLHRRDLTAKEKDFRMLTTELKDYVTPYTIIDDETLKFIDTSVKDGRFYEYRVQFLHKTGTEIKAIGQTYLEYLRRTNEVSFKVSNVRIRKGSTSPDVTMKIAVQTKRTEGTANQTDILQTFLQQSGYGDLYKEDDQKEEMRDSSRDIVMFSIERFNLTTGARELFQLFDPSTTSKFSDRKQARYSKLEALEAGNRYCYVIRAHKVHPSMLFRNARITKTSRSGRKYRVNTSKFLTKKSLRKGVTSSRAGRSKRRLGKNGIFNLGKTGSFKTIVVNLDDTLPTITRGDVDRLNNRENLLSWRIRGDASKIDHFIVSIERMRTKIPIFVAHCTPKAGMYQYVDRYTPRIRGPVEFKILPVYVDYTRGEEVSLGTIISSGIANKRRRRR